MGLNVTKMRDRAVINLINVAQAIVGKLMDLELLMPHEAKVKKWAVFKSFDLSRFAYNKSVYQKIPSVFKRFAMRRIKQKMKLKVLRLVKRLAKFGITFFLLVKFFVCLLLHMMSILINYTKSIIMEEDFSQDSDENQVPNYEDEMQNKVEITNISSNEEIPCQLKTSRESA